MFQTKKSVEGLQSDNDCQEAGQQRKKKREREWETNKLTKLQENLYTFSIKYTQQLKNNKLDTTSTCSILRPVSPQPFFFS